MEAKHSPEAKRQMMVLMQADTSGQGRPACIRGMMCLLPPGGFPGENHLGSRVPPRSELATSCWKAHGWLVQTAHEEEGSRVTRCGHMGCSRRWEPTPLLPGVRVSCLRKPHKCPVCRLLPSLVQVLLVVGPPSWARLVVCRGDQQRTVDHRPPFPVPADSAQGRGKQGKVDGLVGATRIRQLSRLSGRHRASVGGAGPVP